MCQSETCDHTRHLTTLSFCNEKNLLLEDSRDWLKNIQGKKTTTRTSLKKHTNIFEELCLSIPLRLPLALSHVSSNYAVAKVECHRMLLNPLSQIKAQSFKWSWCRCHCRCWCGRRQVQRWGLSPQHPSPAQPQHGPLHFWTGSRAKAGGGPPQGESACLVRLTRCPTDWSTPATPRSRCARTRARSEMEGTAWHCYAGKLG